MSSVEGQQVVVYHQLHMCMHVERANYISHSDCDTNIFSPLCFGPGLVSMSPEVMRSWQITAMINRILTTLTSSSWKRRVESMHDEEDKEEAAVSGEIGKIVDSDGSDSCN